MPRLDHRKLEKLVSPGGVSCLQGDGEDVALRRRRVAGAVSLQMIYAAFTLGFALYEISTGGSLVHMRPPAELFKVVAYSVSCLLVYRSVSLYLRLMLIWTITTAFSGVFQSLLWLEHSSGSATERRLVWTMLVLSIAGMAGNIVGAVTVFPSVGGSSGRARRRRHKSSLKET
ncbi:unnamed protein product [Ectocarpus sp. 12 AP-2014]